MLERDRQSAVARVHGKIEELGLAEQEVEHDTQESATHHYDKLRTKMREDCPRYAALRDELQARHARIRVVELSNAQLRGMSWRQLSEANARLEDEISARRAAVHQLEQDVAELKKQKDDKHGKTGARHRMKV
jgi:predicted RNase H-like nuclease (RuvC/YqgF family)